MELSESSKSSSSEEHELKSTSTKRDVPTRGLYSVSYQSINLLSNRFLKTPPRLMFEHFYSNAPLMPKRFRSTLAAMFYYFFISIISLALLPSIWLKIFAALNNLELTATVLLSSWFSSFNWRRPYLKMSALERSTIIIWLGVLVLR